MFDDDDLTTFEGVTCIAESSLAIYCRMPRDGQTPKYAWVPKSVVHDDSEVFDAAQNSSGKLVVAGWFALKEGLI